MKKADKSDEDSALVAQLTKEGEALSIKVGKLEVSVRMLI